MPDKSTIRKALRDKHEGKSASTQAGEFIHDEIKKIRRGEHGARSAKQAIAIGLSEARRAGVKLPTPKKGSVSEKTRRSSILASRNASNHKPISRKRSMATTNALKRESTSAASKSALSKQAHSAAAKRTATERSASAKKAVRTKGGQVLSDAGKKAARTRARNR